MVLKGDSALLVNRKPFFVPDNAERPVACPCLVVRVSRLGKCISESFATRYYDAVALALDIRDQRLQEQASAQGTPWTAAISMDGSFPVGAFVAPENAGHARFALGETTWLDTTIREADICRCVAEISRTMTIRQGDMLYFPLADTTIPLGRDEAVSAWLGEGQNLYCKIK